MAVKGLYHALNMLKTLILNEPLLPAAKELALATLRFDGKAVSP